MPLTPPQPRRRGYTLIEVLVVVTIIGIAGAVVVPHMLSAGTLGIQAAARMVIADILYAQADAIAHQRTRKVVFDPVTERYRLTDAEGQTLQVKWRTGGSDYAVDFTEDDRFQGVRIESVNFGDTTELEFDALGSPISGGTIVITFEQTRYRITVAAFTGRVTVAEI